MRNELRKAETCPACHRITYDAEYSLTCDACGKPLEQGLKGGNHQYLELKVFPEDHSDNVDDRDFCDWACAARWIRQIMPRKFGFITLPYLHPEDLDGFLGELKSLPPVKQ